MALTRITNYVGNGGNWTMERLHALLAAAGWATISSGSGTEGVSCGGWAFSSILRGSEIILPSEEDPGPPPIVRNVGIGCGSEALGNIGAWFLMEDPAGNRQICFQRHLSARSDAGDAYWGMWYSPGGLFGGGAAATRPTASDEIEILSIGGANFAVGGTSNNLIQAAADNAPSPNGEYGFCFLEFVATNALQRAVFLDDLRAEIAATDPQALAVGAPAELDRATLWTPGVIHVRVDDGGPGERDSTGAYPFYSITGTWYHDLPSPSKYDGEERPLPLHVCDGRIGGYLGRSRWFLQAADSHDYPNTGEGLAHLFVDDVLIRDFWDGATTPATI